MLDERRCGDVYMKMAGGSGRKGSKPPPPELAADVLEAFEAAGVLEAFLAQPRSHQRHIDHRALSQSTTPAGSGSP